MRPKANLPICKSLVKPHVAAAHECFDGYSTIFTPPTGTLSLPPSSPSLPLIRLTLLRLPRLPRFPRVFGFAGALNLNRGLQ